MKPAIRTAVTFHSSAFNVSESKEYFINPGCFGDDLANWLAAGLRSKGHQADTPYQEDFGWYLPFSVADIKYCFVTGYRPADGTDEGLWIGWVERSRGFWAFLLGAHKRGIQPAAVLAIHEILSASQKITNVLWHFERDFNTGNEEAGSPEPLRA